MNARQKAKRYKQQLERMLPKVNKIYIDRTDLIHCKSQFLAYGFETDMYRRDDGTIDPERLNYEVQHKLINDIIPVLKDSIEYNENEGIYSLDIWVKR